MEDNEEEPSNLEELFKRDLDIRKSFTHHQSRQNHAFGEPCSRCECSLNYDIDPTEALQRKKKSKLQHYPSCHCQIDFKRPPPTRTRNAGDIEAILEKSERIYDNPLKSNKIKKSHSTPLSPKSAPRCHGNNGHSHCPKKVSRNCYRQQQQQQQRRKEEDENFTALINDIVRNGIVNEQTEYCDKYINLVPIKSSTKRDCHWKSDQVSQDMPEYSDAENDYCVDTSCEDHHRSKKSDASREGCEMNLKRRENEWIEEDDDQRLKREYRELAKLKYDLREHRKLKNIDDQRCRKEDSSNPMDQLERRKKVVDNETRRKKGDRGFTSRLPVPRVDSKSPNRLQISTETSKKNVEGQRNNKNTKRMEVSTSYHCIDDETDGDFAREEELRKELENIPYSKPCRKSTSGRITKLAKSFKAMCQDDRNVNEKHENSIALVKADQSNNEDLDLHASKSHILSLIDKALSKEFGPLDGKKGDQAKEEITRQELCIEISRALQRGCCHSLVQTLLSHHGTSDYVRHLKTLRWEYLHHIQDKLRKLYDLEKFLDDCTSPRHSLSTLQSHTSNTDQLKHCARTQTSHQQEQKESTS